MPAIRRAAVRLARVGDLRILRKGKPVDPEDFKGVYRLACLSGGPEAVKKGRIVRLCVVHPSLNRHI